MSDSIKVASRNRYNFGKLAVGESMPISVSRSGDSREVRRIREAAYQESQRRETKFSVRSHPHTAIVTRIR